MAKAEFQGICQWCGSTQKLPRGVLSLHGYDVQWGFFNGTCRGSRHLPFEQSIDLIEESIAVNADAAVRLRRQADELLARRNDGGLDAWRHVYHPELSNHSRGAVHLWEGGVIEQAEGKQAEFVYGNGTKRERMHTWGEPAQLAAEGRALYAKHLLAGAAKRDAYVAWQRKRIADWAPKELTRAQA